jgi:hypothetical protein
MPIVWMLLAAITIYGLAIAMVLAWLKLANLADLLILLLWRRAGTAPPPPVISRHMGIF